jgi:hypothetical protein
MKRQLLNTSLTLLGICCLFVAFAHAKDKDKMAMPSASAIQVELLDAGDTAIPAEFRYAVFEHLVTRLQKSGTFQKVYRSGDKGATGAPDLVTVRASVEKFQAGNQMKREILVVAGWTKVTVNVKVTAKDGHVILEKPVTGKVRFQGENLNVTRDLAKGISKLLKENFKATGTPTA